MSDEKADELIAKLEEVRQVLLDIDQDIQDLQFNAEVIDLGDFFTVTLHGKASFT